MTYAQVSIVCPSCNADIVAPAEVYACLNCDTEFDASHQGNKYCSRDCQLQHRTTLRRQQKGQP